MERRISRPRASRRRAREGGMTLIEIAVALGIMIVFFTAVWALMTSQADAVDASFRQLVAESECDRATVAIVEDLQTTNTVETNASGIPYFQIVNGVGEPRVLIEFQRVEGFDADEVGDTVTPIYGTQVRYALTDDDQLIRIQSGQTKVLANRVSTADFNLTPDGTITFRIVAYAGPVEERIEFENSFAVTPRNGYDR